MNLEKVNYGTSTPKTDLAFQAKLLTEPQMKRYYSVFKRMGGQLLEDVQDLQTSFYFPDEQRQMLKEMADNFSSKGNASNIMLEPKDVAKIEAAHDLIDSTFKEYNFSMADDRRRYRFIKESGLPQTWEDILNEISELSPKEEYVLKKSKALIDESETKLTGELGLLWSSRKNALEKVAV